MSLESVVPRALAVLSEQTGLEYRTGIVIAQAIDGAIVLDYGDQVPARVMEMIARATRVIERRVMPGGRSIEIGIREG